MKAVFVGNKVDDEKVFHAAPSLYRLLLPDAPLFPIPDASDSYPEVTLCKRNEVVSKGLFDAFPNNPNHPTANGKRRTGKRHHLQLFTPTNTIKNYGR